MTGYRVLLIDDAEDVHTVVGAYLELSGYRVEHASNGVLGLAAMARATPDLVLLDIQMPVMDGFKTLEAIREADRFGEIPVLMLSSLDRPNLKVKGLQLGADDYITKPFDRAELMARVERAMQRSVRYRRLAKALSGDLGRISLEDILQTIELGHKTACIELPDLGGVMVVREGELAEARWQGFEGEQALARLLFLARGRFEVDFDSVRPGDADRPVLGSINDLLIDLTVYLDEVRSLLDPGLAHDPLIEPVAGAPLPAFGPPGPPVWPATVAEVLARLPDELKQNVPILLQELAAGSLRTIDREGV